MLESVRDHPEHDREGESGRPHEDVPSGQEHVP